MEVYKFQRLSDFRISLLFFLGHSLPDLLDHLASLRRVSSLRLQPQILFEHLQRPPDFRPRLGDVTFSEIDLPEREVALMRFRFELESLPQSILGLIIFLLPSIKLTQTEVGR